MATKKERRIEIQQVLGNTTAAVQQQVKGGCAAFPRGSGSGLMVRIRRVKQKLRHKGSRGSCFQGASALVEIKEGLGKKCTVV